MASVDDAKDELGVAQAIQALKRTINLTGRALMDLAADTPETWIRFSR